MYIKSKEKLIRDEWHPFEILAEVFISNYEFLLPTVNTFADGTEKFYSNVAKCILIPTTSKVLIIMAVSF